MTRTTVGGALDWRRLADDRDLHRPTDPALIAREVRRLAAGGLTARDIATSLRLPLADVFEFLFHPDRNHNGAST